MKIKNSSEKKKNTKVKLSKQIKILGIILATLLVLGLCFLVPSFNVQSPVAYEDEYLKIPRYKNIKVSTIPEKQVTDDAIEERLKEVIAAEADYAGVDASVFVFDDAYVASMNSEVYSNIEEFKEFLKSTLEEEYNAAYIDTVSTKVLDVIMEETTVKKYPEGMVEKEKEELMADDVSIAEEDYASFEEYIEEVYGADTQEDYEQAVAESAKNVTKQKLVTEAIVNQENIALTDDDMEVIYDNYAIAYEVTVEELKSDEWADWMNWVTYNKEDWIMREYLTKVSDISYTE